MNKPTGIYVFSIIHAILGICLLIGFSFGASQILESVSKTQTPPGLFIAGWLIISLFLIISSVGLFLGKKYGGYIASLFYAVFFWDTLFTLFTLPHDFLGFAFIQIQNSLKIIFLFLLFSYFFKNTVSQYLLFSSETKYKRMGSILGIALAIQLLSILFIKTP